MSGRILAQLSEIPDGGAIAVDAIVLTRRGGAVFAYENRCAHAEYSLQRDDGSVTVQQGRFLVCAVHGASYAMETGACAGGPCNGKGLKRIAVAVSDGAVRLA